jgi:ankyrin repeat protein
MNSGRKSSDARFEDSRNRGNNFETSVPTATGPIRKRRNYAEIKAYNEKLFVAARDGKFEDVTLLLGKMHKADLAASDKATGRMALHHAAMNGHKDVAVG